MNMFDFLISRRSAFVRLILAACILILTIADYRWNIYGSAITVIFVCINLIIIAASLFNIFGYFPDDEA